VMMDQVSKSLIKKLYKINSKNQGRLDSASLFLVGYKLSRRSGHVFATINAVDENYFLLLFHFSGLQNGRVESILHVDVVANLT